MNFSPENLQFGSEIFLRNPYPWYAVMRDKVPIFFFEGARQWVVSRYKDVAFCLGKTETFAAARVQDAIPPHLHQSLQPTIDSLSKMVFFSDGIAHRHRRKLVDYLLSSSVVEDHREQIGALVEQRFDKLRERDTFDFCEDVAYPLTISALAMIMGIPQDDWHRLEMWTSCVKTLASYRGDDEAYRQAQESYLECLDYLENLLDQDHPTKQFRRVLEFRNSALTTADICSQLVSLLVGGHDTAKNLLANAINALYRNPDQRVKLAENPTLMDSAISELIRFAGPGQLSARRVLKAVEVAGQPLSEGDGVFLMIAAGNHDPERFTNPDRLDVSRAPNPHLGFGLGVHRCSGADLSRALLEIVLEKALRLPSLRLVDDVESWSTDNLMIRSLTRLPMAF